MEILRARALAGVNVWSRASVLEARVALGEEAGGSAAAFEQRLRAWLPGVAPAGSGAAPSVRVAAALVGAAVALQGQVSGAGGRGFVGELASDGTLDVAFEVEEAALGRACLASARQLCQAALGGASLDVTAEIARLRALAEDVCLGRATGPLVAAAQARGIPWRRLDGESLVQLGHGARRRRIRTSLTERTGKLAEWLSVDKELCKRLLAEVGLPVPVGRRVGSAEEAWAAACELGLPVAIKPASADYGHGIGLHLGTREQVLAAYAAAREYREEVLVERFVRGEQFRVTVVDGKVVAAVRREPVRLVGDGVHTVSDLMAIANRDPQRGDDLRQPLNPVGLDDDTPQMLAEQGLALDTIVPAGREVVLSRIAHSWAGAGVSDVTDEVHPAVAAQCVRAARLVGLDVAGLDIVAPDLARPLDEQGGAILEVNAEPTIAFHFPPLCSTFRPVCDAIIASLFPDGQTGRIPLALVTGTGARDTIGRVLAAMLGAHGVPTVRASATGLFLGDERVKPGEQGNLAGTLAALLMPEGEAAVLERALSGIRAEGLGVDRVDVAVFSRVSAEHAAAAAAVLTAVAAGGTVVVPADDAALVAACTGKVILVGHGAETRHAAVFRRDGGLVFRSSEGSEQVAPLAGAAAGAGGDWLDAAAAAWAMGVPAATIAARLPALLRVAGT